MASKPRRTSHGAGVAAFAFALLSIPLSSCGLADLAAPGEFHELDVEPREIFHSLVALREGPRTIHLRVSGAGPDPVRWSGRTLRAAPWIELHPAQGETPAEVAVVLDPAGLEAGAYHDTLQFSLAETGAGSVRVSVVLELADPAMFECPVRAIELQEEVTDSLTVTSCQAQSGGGRPAQRLSFDPGDHDSVSVVLATDAFAAGLSLLGPSGDPLEEADDCPFEGADVCLLYAPVSSDGTHTVEVSADAPDAAGAFTVSVVPPRSPEQPAELEQRSTETGAALAPGASLSERSILLRARLSDPDPWDRLRLEVEIRREGRTFTGIPTHRSDDGAEREREVRVEDLEAGRAYRWRGRAADQTGRAGPWLSFENASGGPAFVVEAPPEDEPEDPDPGDPGSDPDDPDDPEDEDPGEDEACDLRDVIHPGDLGIPDGETCTLTDVTILGDLEMGDGARLVATSVKVGGDVRAAGADELTLVDSSIGGELRFEDGGSLFVHTSAVGEDARIRGNEGRVELEGSIFGQNVGIRENRGGPFTIVENRIDGNLDCEDNDPAPEGAGNIVQGESENQCAEL